MENNNLKLTKEQKKVIKNNADFLIVSAGPGSGKTETLIHYLEEKINNLKNNKQIIICSFTRNSSIEIKNRATKQKDSKFWKSSFFSTFDSFLINKIWRFYFNRILNFAAIKINVNFHIHKINFEKLIYSKLSWNVFNKNKDDLLWFTNEVEKFLKYALQGILHYGFIAEKLLLLFLKENGEIQNYIKETFERIIVDEAQDLSELRYLILIEIHKICNVKITLIGDERQTLYRFLGAKERVFQWLSKEISSAKILKLTKNWRYLRGDNDKVDPNILKILNSKNEKQFKENLSNNMKLKKIFEIKDIFEYIKKIDEQDEILILLKTNSDINKISNTLTENKIKHGAILKIDKSLNIDHNTKIFIENLYVYNLLKRKELNKNIIKHDIVDEICHFIWPYDPKANDKFIKLFWKNEVNFDELILKIEMLKKIKIKEMWELLKENQDYISVLPQKRLQLMTIHASKGLESDYVFVEEKIITTFIDPSTKKREDFENIFVALSRFKKKLVLF